MLRIVIFKSIWLDVHFALRTFIARPAFSAVVVLTLGLGIGVNTAIFSAVNGVLLRPLAFDHPEQLVRVWDRSFPLGGYYGLRSRVQAAELATYSYESGYNLLQNGESTRVVADGVSWNLFSVLGVKPELGRDFTREDEATETHTVIISHSLWQTRFGGDPAIIGRTIVLDEKNMQIIGIMPPGFYYPNATHIWGALTFDPSSIYYWGWGYNVIGRLRPGYEFGRADSEFRTVLPDVLKMIPLPLAPGFGKDARLVPLKDSTVVKARTMLLALFGAVSVIMLVACVNVANLLLARSAARQKEMAVRAALGAARGRIAMQLLTESVVLGLAGGALGLLMAWPSFDLMKSMLPADTPRLAEISIDGHVLAYTTVMSFVAGLVFGMVPAFHASRTDIEQALRANSRSSSAGSSRSIASGVLVVAEVAMAVVLVCGAGLLIKTLWHLNRMETGVQNDEQVLIADLTPSQALYEKTGQGAAFYSRVLEDVRGIPGIESAALSDTLPMVNLFGGPMTIQDRPESVTIPYQTWMFEVSPGYFKTMGIPLLRGRDFTIADRRGTPPVMIVSRKFAQTVWPGEDPLGKVLRPSPVKEWSTIVGVVEDVQHFSATPLTSHKGAVGDIYAPAAQGMLILPYYLSIIARSHGDLSTLQQQITAAVRRTTSSVPLSNWRTMRSIAERSVSRPRATTWLFVICAGLALLLGLIGIYSVISCTVTYRTREIGVRMAVGADRRDILWMMLRSGAMLTFMGLILGLAVSLALSRFLHSMLYGLSAFDPLIYTIVVVLVAVAAMLATFLPSLRATRVEPTVALRCE